MPLELNQFGGYTGSTAGDCFVIGDGNSYLMIDVGLNKNATSTAREGTQAQKGLHAVRTARDLDLIVTHFHDDHVNKGRSWDDLRALNPRVHYGQAVKKVGLKYQQALRESFGDQATQYGHQQNGHLAVEKDFGDWKLQAFLIVPVTPTTGAALDENDVSLGVLIELTHRDQTRVNMLTLGDMSCRAGDAAVKAVLEQRKLGIGHDKGRIDIVKLSHHGSKDNILPVLDDVVTSDCTLLISGYTLTDYLALLGKKKKWKPKAVMLLFDPERGMQEWDLGIGDFGRKALAEASVQHVTGFNHIF